MQTPFDEIRAWIIQVPQDFESGMALLWRYGKQATYFALERKGPSALPELRTLLQALAREVHGQNPIPPRGVVTDPLYNPRPRESLAQPMSQQDVEFSERKQDVLTGIRRLYNQRAKLSNTLIDFAPDDNAGRLAVIREMQAITGSIEDTKSNTRVQTALEPVRQQIQQMEEMASHEIAKLIKRRNTLRTYITRITKQLAALAHGTKGHTTKSESLQRYMVELDEINKKIPA